MGRTGSGGVALLVWIAGGVIAIVGALTFAELGAMMPKIGGQFVVIREAFGRRMGFLQVASVTLTVQCGAIGILALVCSQYFLHGCGWIPASPRPLDRIPITVGALVAILLVWGINVAGIRPSARVLRANVALKLLTIAAIVGVAAFSGRKAPPDAFSVEKWPTAHDLVYALIPTLFSYGGFEQVLWAAGEVRDPRKNVALGIMAGVLVVVVAYVAINVSFLSLLGPAGVGEGSLVAARAVEAAAPGYGILVAFAVSVSALGTTHAIVLTSPRQILALARDGLAPRFLGRISPRTTTPVAATSVIAGISALFVLLAGSEGLDALLDAVICVNWAFFAVTAASLLVLRKTRPDLPRPFRVPGYPITPAVFALIALAAAASPFFQEKGRIPAILAAVLVLTLGLLSRFWIQDPKSTGQGSR